MTDSVVFAAAIVAASFFMVALRAMAIPSIAALVIATGREAARVMGDKTLGDHDKERLLRKASIAMMRSFGSIAIGSAVAVAAALIPLFALQAAGLTELASVAHAAATWQGIVLTGLAMTAVYFVRIRS